MKSQSKYSQTKCAMHLWVIPVAVSKKCKAKYEITSNPKKKGKVKPSGSCKLWDTMCFLSKPSAKTGSFSPPLPQKTFSNQSSKHKKPEKVWTVVIFTVESIYKHYKISNKPTILIYTESKILLSFLYRYGKVSKLEHESAPWNATGLKAEKNYAPSL